MTNHCKCGCGTEIADNRTWSIGHHRRNTQHSDNTRSKMSYSHIGEKNSMYAKPVPYIRRMMISATLQNIPYEGWSGFKSSERELIFRSQEYNLWRISVFERDDYTCQMCGEWGHELNGHHILKISDYPELVFDINNGITLCKDCHVHKVDRHEEDYEDIFNNILYDRSRGII